MTLPEDNTKWLDSVLVNLYLGENFTEKTPNWIAQMKNPELQKAKQRAKLKGVNNG